MLRLVNAVYTKDKRIQKRNGYASITSLPTGTNATTLATFNGNLVAIGNSLYSYSSGSAQWISHGRFQPVQLSTQSIYRSSLSQSNLDSAVSPVGLSCTVFLDGDSLYKYVVNDATTGTQIVAPVSLAATATSARVFALPSYFVITFMATVGGAPHFQYIAIPLGNLTNPTAATDLSTAVESISIAHDGYVANNTLYLAFGGSDVSGSVKVTALPNTLSQTNVVTFTGHHPALMSVTADVSGASPVIWVSFYATSGTTLYALAVDGSLNTILGVTSLSATGTRKQITSTATGNVLTVFSQISNTYSYSSVRSDFISSITCTSAGTVGSQTTRVRSVGLASEAFLYNGVSYMLAVYGGTYQPSYFLIDGSGNVVAKLAYSNGSGYVAGIVLPSAVPNGSTVNIAYQVKDLIESVNKSQGATSVAGIYSQTGVNLATLSLANTNLITAEIGDNLHIAGGFLWMFDGTSTVEHGFHLWPEDLAITTATGSGGLTAQQYYYQVVYEWMDAQGNIHRSAPSVPVSITTTTGSSTNTLNIPTLRLTYKTSVKITVFRWSAGQQSYYQVTSVASPLLNDPTTDSVAFVDAQADSAIIGNSLIYTTGGVVENVAAPACSSLALYKSRLMVLSAEDPNSVWYSKQVIESTPVETSDLFTLYTAPTTGAQGSTGPSKVLSAMDDKFIVAKADALYYFTGTGPDNTGANNDLSDPVFIASTVGTELQHSVALIPQGLVFQSDKGIWLLGRDLSTQYIGSRVEDYSGDPVVDTQVIPGTNQVRFCLTSGNLLMYDYFFDRWGTFSNVPAISATLYGGYHTYLTAEGSIRQETPNTYLDAGVPVLMSFTTAWMNLAGLQGFQRAYMVYLIGTYLSAHKLQVQIAYNYGPSPTQSVMINPTNYAGYYGGPDQLNIFGQGGSYGGPGSLEQWRVFLSTQKCQSFQVTVNEVFDPAQGTPPGAGLTFSGLNLVVGAKKGYVPLPASQSVG